MGETVKLILSLSVSGGLFALALFMLKPLMRNRLSKSFQYYIWLVVLLRFILPFSFGVNLMDLTLNAPGDPQPVAETIIPNYPINPENVNPAVNNAINRNEPIIAEQQPPTKVSMDSVKPFDIMGMLADNLLWVWLAGAVISAAFNILGYLRIIQHIHGAAYAVEISDCGAKVYKSRFAPTPMLVGVIRARIYLPDIEYTDEQMNNILLHELTHLRRRDIWLKWFAAFVASVHWFNPIVYFMRREFNRACELSCDEAVIRNLDGTAKQSYGDTLISVVAESRYPAGVMSVTMCEEKKKLKERLIAIMNYKKRTKIAVLIAAVLAVVITGSAFAFGANVTGIFSANKPQSSTDAVGQDDTVYFDDGDIHFIFIDGANKKDAPLVSVTSGSIAIVLVDKNGYWTFSPYKDISELSEDIRKDCLEMINRKSTNNGFSETHMNHIMKRVESIVNPTAAIIPSLEDAARNEETNYSEKAQTNWNITTTNQSYEFTTYNRHEEGDELLLAANIKNNWTGTGLREQLMKNAVPNQVESIKTISAAGIEKLLINAELCGIVVETAEGSEYTIDYIGVQNKTSISVSTSIENGVLSVSAQGSGNTDLLVSTVRGSRINVVRIGVPKNSVKEINIQNEATGCIMIDGVDVPVNGNAKSGVIRAQSKTLNADINLEAGNGNIIVKGNVVSSNITMTVANGSAYVEGDTVDGNLRLSSKNGSVNVTAGSVRNGEFTAANGEVTLKIGVIDQKVSAKVANGELNIQLLKKPTNLRYVQTSKPNTNASLPYGWKDGYQVGNGSALLEVSVGNGDLSLSVKQ